MGRPKIQNTDLPPRLRLSHGSYFYVKKGVWTNLGKDKFRALGLYQRAEASHINERPIQKHVAHIKPLDELRKLRPATEVNGPGVYFLWQGAALHYIGRSKNVRNRVRYHRTPKMGIPHTHSTALSCDKYVSLLIEAVHIDHYRPPGNELFI